MHSGDCHGHLRAQATGLFSLIKNFREFTSLPNLMKTGARAKHKELSHQRPTTFFMKLACATQTFPMFRNNTTAQELCLQFEHTKVKLSSTRVNTYTINRPNLKGYTSQHQFSAIDIIRTSQSPQEKAAHSQHTN